MRKDAPHSTAAREGHERTLRAVATAPFLSHAMDHRRDLARLYAGIAEQESRVIEAPGRRAILSAIQDALYGHEASLLDFDTTLPENIVAYRQALDDVRSEIACDGRIMRAAGAILALKRLRGRAPQ